MIFSAIVQRVVAAYETRLADAKRESAGLRAALSQLEKEHRALVNEQARHLPAPELNRAVTHLMVSPRCTRGAQYDVISAGHRVQDGHR